MIDTVKLARSTLPGLISYGLDHLMFQLSIPRPPDRHRAMPDVEATTEIAPSPARPGRPNDLYADLGQLTKAIALVPRASQPQQDALF